MKKKTKNAKKLAKGKKRLVDLKNLIVVIYYKY